MYGSQPKLSSVVESSVQAFSLGSIPKILICDNNLNGHLRKELNFGDITTSFSAKWRLEMTAEISYPRQIWVVLLIAIFPRHTTNQKHYPDLGIGTSSVWNFCSHFSGVNSQGHHWWCWKISAVFSGYLRVVQFSWCKVAMQLGVAMWVVTGLDVDPSSCSFPKAPFIYGEKLSWVEGTLPYQMWWVVYVRNNKLASLEEWPAQPGGRETALLHHNDFVHS